MPRPNYTKTQIELLVQHLAARRTGLVAQLDGYNCLPREQRDKLLAGQIAYTKNVIGWLTGEIGRLEQSYAGLRSATAAESTQSAANANRRRANSSNASD